jgi:hypothetical protein|tara:strand:- start:80 stop:805 length:726 start_codon:yes stop_codon:yes gene_type:complete
MDYRSIREFKDTHKGKDIYVICAGPSSNFVPPRFFTDKIVIGVNNVFKKFPCNYVISKDLQEHPRYTRMVEEIKKTEVKLIFSKYHTGHLSDGENKPNLSPEKSGWYFEHLDNKSAEMGEEVLSVIGTDKLVVSRSTVTSALNLAAYMGAQNIILVGHDCGSIDGELYDPTYTESDWHSANNYTSAPKWVGSIEPQTIAVKKRLKLVYDCDVVSLNPFINFGLEGHTYNSNSRDDSGQLIK